MIERVSRRPESNRFLGDEAEMVVHDLENEDKTEQGCYIGEIFGKGMKYTGCFLHSLYNWTFRSSIIKGD